MSSSRPRSASSGRRDAGGSSTALRGHSRDRDPPTSSRSARPRSAQPPPKGPGRASKHMLVDPERAIQALQGQCLEMKSAANAINDENLKLRTRLMALERELQKRGRILQMLEKLNKNNQGVSLELIEKLREERNMLPIYRKKAHDLQLRIEEKEAEIMEMKRDPQFTKIIELQVEYASWQHEAKRLEGLLQEPSPEVNEAARREIEVHERRVDQLENAKKKAEERRSEIEAEIADLEADHENWTQQHKEKEKELLEEQEITRELAAGFKQLLTERKEAEQLQAECEEMELDRQRCQDELDSLLGSGNFSAGDDKTPGRASLSYTVLRSALPPIDPQFESVLWALRQEASSREGEGSLFAHLLAQDKDSDGLLSVPELAAALELFGCPVAVDDAVNALVISLPVHTADNGKTGRSRTIRWLEILAFLDRLSSTTGPPAALTAQLPELQMLRGACLRLGISQEKFRQDIMSITGVRQVEAVFGRKGLRLNGEAVDRWTEAWQAHGSVGLVRLLPMSEVTPSDEARAAWLARCAEAVRVHKSELEDAFATWRSDMQMSDFEFQMVCGDVLGVELSEDDISDLALFAGDGHGADKTVDAAKVLKLEVA